MGGSDVSASDGETSGLPATTPCRQPAPKLWVVLPAYNEEENLGPLLEGVAQTFHDWGRDYEVIVVDDGSSDGTAGVAAEHAERMPLRVVPHERNQGLGATIRDGLRAATVAGGDDDIVVALDADNTQPPGLIPSMAGALQEGSDVVIASRYQPGAAVVGVPLHRRFLSWGAALLFRLVFPVRGVRDYTCGYRAYRSDLLRRAFEQFGDGFVSEEGFQCMVDILLKLRQMGARFCEVPLVLRYDLKGGASKMRVGRTVLRTLSLLVRRRLGH